MGQSARVKSIEVLDVIASALKTFRADSLSALDDLDIELHRALEWIHHDRTEYWKRELRRSEDKLIEAKLQLKQAQTSRRMDDYRPDCVEEQRALERAKQRLRTAEQKFKAVQLWTHNIDRAVSTCQQARTQFVIWLDGEVPKGVAALKRMSGSLETYVSLQVPVDPNAPAVRATDTSQAGAGDAEPSDPEHTPLLAADGNTVDADPQRKDAPP
jgi:hypothetical protein